MTRKIDREGPKCHVAGLRGKTTVFCDSEPLPLLPLKWLGLNIKKTLKVLWKESTCVCEPLCITLRRKMFGLVYVIQ